MLRHVLLAVLLVALSSGLSAQTSTLPCSANCTLARQQPFSVVYDWAPTTLNPDMADGFRLYQNGVIVSTVGISAWQNGRVSFGFASGLSQSGTYLFNVAAFTSGGENLSDTISVVVVKGKPAKPTNGRLE